MLIFLRRETRGHCRRQMRIIQRGGTSKVKFASRLGHDRRTTVVSGTRRGKEVTVKDTGGSHSHFLGLSSVLTAAIVARYVRTARYGSRWP